MESAQNIIQGLILLTEIKINSIQVAQDRRKLRELIEAGLYPAVDTSSKVMMMTLYKPFHFSNEYMEPFWFCYDNIFIICLSCPKLCYNLRSSIKTLIYSPFSNSKSIRISCITTVRQSQAPTNSYKKKQYCQDFFRNKSFNLKILIKISNSQPKVYFPALQTKYCLHLSTHQQEISNI